MSSDPPSIPQLARRSLVDPVTALVMLLMVGGLPVVGWAFHLGHLPWWVALLLGTLLMNLSFTAWHEPAHGNFSSSKRLNALAGILCSWASVYPGYFARRREHLIHHRYEGQDEDPVYPRIQTSGPLFLWMLFKVAVFGESWNAKVPAAYLPYTRAQRACDLLSNLLSASLVGLSVYAGFWLAVLLVWVVPRGIILLAHAYYICFFPHAVPGGGYTVYRVRPSPLLWFLTVGQNLHGLHHKWPAIPWYRYAGLLRRHREEVDAAGVEVL